jgi:hypothetical protein
VQYDNFDPVKAQTILASGILAHPDLTLIIASTGPEGQGAAAAVAQAGKKGKIKILAFDAVVNYLRAHPAGGPVPTGTAPTKLLSLGIITPATVNSPAAAGYEYSATCNS